jgi:uncharacterized membrane protein YfcA
MSELLSINGNVLFPVSINASQIRWGIAGGGDDALEKLSVLLKSSPSLNITVVSPEVNDIIRELSEKNESLQLVERTVDAESLEGINMLIVATGNKVLDEKIYSEAKQQNILVYAGDENSMSDFVFPAKKIQPVVPHVKVKKGINGRIASNSEQWWNKLTSRLILAFLLMVVGHLVISYLPLPTIPEMVRHVKPYFDYHFVFFVLAGFLAQMVDGVLSMGYGVTSATCLMSFGVPPVAMSGAIHTSEIFTTGISGYSHYKFGNVNKKLFRHLVIPGIIGAILGAVMLVYLNDQYGKWIMPVVAVYAGFLGLKILIKAFQVQPRSRKVRRIGWLAWIGGFLDSFGGGGWGPIVTSSLIAKGRSPKYTIGSVSLTEFFVTLSSAFTFFLTVGVSNWNIVLGLLIGGGIAAPIAARLAGKLPRKTMMIAVGIMVMIWCIRMIIKSL